MKKFCFILVASILFTAPCYSQIKPKTTKFPAGVPVKELGIDVNGGSVEERTYRNKKFLFDVTVPENWYIAGTDFEKIVQKKGYDISLNLPANILNRPAGESRKVDILMTAFRSEPDAKESSILRITAEDLKPNPQIRDAVDYFDAITAAYMTTNLPPDFSYSGTKAERLGMTQFAYLDTSSNAGKKRMYATVRKGFAIMFTLSYSNNTDLQTLKRILEMSNFVKLPLSSR